MPTIQTKLTAPERKLLTKIADGVSHRSSWETYEALKQRGLAECVEWGGWKLTDSGRAILKR